MNTTEDKMKKPDTRPTALEEIRIASLEEEVAEWRKAADSFLRERNTSDAALAEIEALLPPPEGDDQGIMSRVRRLVTARAVSRQMLDEIEAALPPAYPNEFGLAQRVRGIVARSTPRTEPALSTRDLAILAPLLDTIDVRLADNDGARALAAVRAVVGVERG